MAKVQNDQAKLMVDAQAKQADTAVKSQKVQVEAFEATTDRMRAEAEIATPRMPASNPYGTG